MYCDLKKFIQIMPHSLSIEVASCDDYFLMHAINSSSRDVVEKVIKKFPFNIKLIVV